MAQKKETEERKPWERLPEETPEAYEAFKTYRDLEGKRSQARVGEKLGKSDTLMSRWSADYDWVKRAQAWDDEVERESSKNLLKDIAKMRARQRKQALKMQLKGLDLLNGINQGDAKLSEIVSLMKLGMEQERICMGDVGEVIEERNGGEAVPAVQIYIPTNNRESRDTFEDLEVEHEPESD